MVLDGHIWGSKIKELAFRCLLDMAWGAEGHSPWGLSASVSCWHRNSLTQWESDSRRHELFVPGGCDNEGGAGNAQPWTVMGEEVPGVYGDPCASTHPVPFPQCFVQYPSVVPQDVGDINANETVNCRR